MRFFALQELSNRKPLEVTAPSNKLSDYYGSHVFDRKKMQEYLPKEAYKAVIDAIEKGTPINREIAGGTYLLDFNNINYGNMFL